jgi:protein TonB
VNQSAISVAVVDGKNGVANAFRLGASLVLSKPISIEQARGTLRNALAMLRKASGEPAKSGQSGHAPSQVTSAPAVTAPAASMIAAPIKPAPAKLAPEPSHAPVAATPAPKISEQLLKTTLPIPAPASSDIHLADEGTPQPKATKSKSVSLINDESPSTGPSKQPAPPMFGMTAEKAKSPRKMNPVLLGAVAVALVAAGVYAYSMVNPGFQSLVISQYTNLQTMVGLAPKPQAVAAIPRPTPSPKPAMPAKQSSTPGNTAGADSQPDGFAQAAEVTPSQGFASTPAPQKTATPVIVSTSASTPQKPAVDSEPLVVAEDVADSHVAYRLQPAYPEAAHKKGVKGDVILTANVDKDGNVSSVDVVSGNAQLATAAVSAVKQWRYEAYYHNGQPTEFQTQVTVRFPQPVAR